MEICPKCRNEVADEAVFCQNCGNKLKEMQSAASDNGSIGWGILGFISPLVGFILYLSWKNSKPNSSKIAGKGALISIVFSIIYIILVAASQ